MSKKENSEVLEISFPKFLLPVIVIVVALVLFFVFSSGNNEEEDVLDTKADVGFSDPSIVEANVVVNFDEGAYIGNTETAKYAIVEFSDYNCPFCARHSSDTFPMLKESYVDEGEVLYFFREVAAMSQESLTLSILGQCIYENEGLDEYFDYRAKAYNLDFENDEELLEKADVVSESVETCFVTREYGERIENNAAVGEVAGVQGVPGFIVGELAEDGNVDGFIISGAYPFETFKEVLDFLQD